MLKMSKQLCHKILILSVVRSKLKVKKTNENIENGFRLSFERFVLRVKKQIGVISLA